MDVYQRGSTPFRRIRDFTWDKKFTVRQTRRIHLAEDDRVVENPTDTRTIVDAFLDIRKGALDPPEFSHEALEEFLYKGDLRFLATSTSPTIHPEKLAFLDDRRDETGGPELTRNWESEKYARYPPEGHDDFTKALSVRDLYKKLKEKVCNAA